MEIIASFFLYYESGFLCGRAVARATAHKFIMNTLTVFHGPLEVTVERY